MRFVLYAIVAYILYQFIFKLVIPVWIASRKIKKGFREMHERMQGNTPGAAQGNQQNDFTTQAKPQQPKPKTRSGDYIDFEEVK